MRSGLTIYRKLLTGLTVLVLILSIAGFSAASLVSLHIHVLPDGRVVSHSHSHSDTDDRTGRDHGHNQREYTVLSAVTHFLSKITFAAVCTRVLFYELYDIVIVGSDFYLPYSIVRDITERSPPSLPRI